VDHLAAAGFTDAATRLEPAPTRFDPRDDYVRLNAVARRP
jgi:hypothetical protein